MPAELLQRQSYRGSSRYVYGTTARNSRILRCLAASGEPGLASLTG